MYCRAVAEGNCSIHRDGFGVGPTVDLCDACGSGPIPSARDIWERIAKPARGSLAYRRHESLKEDL